MKTLKQLERLRKIHKLIQHENTGSPSEFANKLGVSRRQLYNLMDYLKEIEAPLLFNRNTKTYYYSDDFDLIIHVSLKVLVKEELKIIYGGHIFLKENFLSARLLHGTSLYWLYQI